MRMCGMTRNTMRMCVWEIAKVSGRVSVCVRECATYITCVCECQESKHDAHVCVCEREREWIYVCERVTAYKGERERGREGERERGRERETVYVCVCEMCVWERVCVCRECVLACVCHKKKQRATQCVWNTHYTVDAFSCVQLCCSVFFIFWKKMEHNAYDTHIIPWICFRVFQCVAVPFWFSITHCNSMRIIHRRYIFVCSSVLQCVLFGGKNNTQCVWYTHNTVDISPCIEMCCSLFFIFKNTIQHNAYDVR